MNVHAAIDITVLVSSPRTKNPDSPTARVVDAVASGVIVPSIASKFSRSMPRFYDGLSYSSQREG